MSELRFRMVEAAITRKAVRVPHPTERPSAYFGRLVFNEEKMRQYLPAKSFEALAQTMLRRAPLPRAVADSVAAGMKQWAMELGVTHYTHWFQPLTGGTAEKHDAFIEPDGHGGIIEELEGKLLIQQEPDASSFPSGGIRNTFEARGYSAWDPTSPAFVVGTTLCIPTVFISYTGEALDFKAPLLRAIRAVDQAATEVCRYFDPKVARVTSYLGWEQEYFLVDQGLWAARPDLMLTGRTLMGHESAKNQQLEDHYFGAIPSRVLAFMKDLEYACLALGIPVKTRHNEVAPNQFELAPVYEETNLANDHNQLLLSTLRKVARKHNFRCLLHEKPFKGINGSGKHNNWSLGTDTGVNLFAPGRQPKENLQFITFLVNAMMAVYRYNGLLKAAVMSATNAHRLGGGEAPPAIISVFLGTQLTNVLDSIEKSRTEEVIELGGKAGFKMKGIEHIPELLLDNTDRNRTSPFAFTGNRFEFRAVGSSDNCADAMITLNTAMAGQLTDFKKEVDKLVGRGTKVETAIFKTLQKYIKASRAIRFDGNGYSEAWRAEAGRRGLDTETCAPRVVEQLIQPHTVALFTQTGVMSRVELHARAEIKWEMYTKKIQIEARVLGDLVMNHILPVASRYQSALLDKAARFGAVFPPKEAARLSEQDRKLIVILAEHLKAAQTQTEQLVEARKVANRIEDEREKALAYHDRIVPMLEEIRRHVDKLELIVDNQMWPLPKYRELLFLR